MYPCVVCPWLPAAHMFFLNPCVQDPMSSWQYINPHPHSLTGHLITPISIWWRQTSQKPWSWYISDQRESPLLAYWLSLYLKWNVCVSTANLNKMISLVYYNINDTETVNELLAQLGGIDSHYHYIIVNSSSHYYMSNVNNQSWLVDSWSHDLQYCCILTQNTILTSQNFPILPVIMVLLLWCHIVLL